MDEKKELQIIDKCITIDVNDTLVIENKTLFIYKNISCYGTLIIKNCHIVYGKVAKEKIIKADKGSRVEISNCIVEERGSHESVFITADEIAEQDDVVISNCKFIRDYTLGTSRKDIPYIKLCGGGIIRKCDFHIYNKLLYGIIDGDYSKSNYISYKIKKPEPIKGETIDSEGYKNGKKPYYVNVKNIENNEKTLVENCIFNDSYVGVYKNCIVDNCTFKKCKIATKDVYNVKNCKFIKCKKAFYRNNMINLDNAIESCQFDNCNKKVCKYSEIKAKLETKTVSFIEIVCCLSGFLISDEIGLMAMGRIIVYFITIGCLFLFLDQIYNYIARKEFKYMFFKTIAKTILTELILGGLLYFCHIWP